MAGYVAAVGGSSDVRGGWRFARQQAQRLLADQVRRQQLQRMQLKVNADTADRHPAAAADQAMRTRIPP